jgi:hypothetical protein
MTIEGKFQITLTIKQFVDVGDCIEIHPITDYRESCWDWEDAKKSFEFFIKRTEDKLKDK